MKQMKKNNSGITLIALIITIIVLLILAGVSISLILGQNGIISRAINAEDETNKGTAKENLQLIMSEAAIDYYENILGKSKLQFLADYLYNKNEVEYVSLQAQANAEKGTINSNQITVADNNSIFVKLKDYDYEFEVDKDYNIVDTKQCAQTATTQATYAVKSIDGNKYNVEISISNPLGIEYIQTPTGKIDGKKQTNMTLEYVVDKNEGYQFAIKAVNKESETFSLDGTKVNAITISSTSTLYPTFTEYGVKKYSVATITATGGTSNIYYSLDEGSTWKKYDGNLYIEDNCTIQVKNQVDKEITQIISKSITKGSALAGDALEGNAYDGLDTTSVSYNRSSKTFPLTRYVYVDETMSDKNFTIKHATTTPSNPTYGIKIYFYDAQGGEIKPETTFTASGTNTVHIPNGTKKMKFYFYIINGGTSGGAGSVSITEMTYMNEPTFSETKYYPLMTSYGINPGYSIVKISYSNTSVQKLYKIDDGEWLEYKGEEIRLELGKKLYAKGIDKNGKPTRITSELQAKLPGDALEGNAYDELTTTSVSYNRSSHTMPLERYVHVNEDMEGKNFTIIHSTTTPSNPTYGIKIYFYDAQGGEIKPETSFTSGGTDTVHIPEGTKKMKFYFYVINGGTSGGAGSVSITEMTYMNEPTFSETKYYPVMTSSKVNPGYSIVKISYSNTSVQKLYKIDDGEWLEYKGEEIRLELGKKLYAKGIDKNGKPTRITSELQAKLPGDALEGNAYDRLDTTSVSFNKTSNTLPLNRYLLVDEGMGGKSFSIKHASTVSSNPTYGIKIYFYDAQGGEIKPEASLTGSGTENVTILEGTRKMKFEFYLINAGWSGGAGSVSVTEITPQN